MKKHGSFLWKIKKSITITTAFQKTLNESNRKPNKISVDKCSGFYNRLMKSWLEKKAIGILSTDNKGKSVVADRFIRTFKGKLFKYLTWKSKDMYFGKLDYIVNKYNNMYSTIIWNLLM